MWPFKTPLTKHSVFEACRFSCDVAKAAGASEYVFLTVRPIHGLDKDEARMAGESVKALVDQKFPGALLDVDRTDFKTGRLALLLPKSKSAATRENELLAIGEWCDRVGLKAGPACACMGPQMGEPRCPCLMKEVVLVGDRYFQINITATDIGPVKIQTPAPTKTRTPARTGRFSWSA